MKAKKQGVKIARKADIIVLCSIAGIILLCIILYFGTNLAYSLTEVPDDLSAQETVEQYFKYWDAGNNKGQNLIKSDFCAAEYVLTDGAMVKGEKREKIPWYKSLSLIDLVDKIEVTNVTQLELVPDYGRLDEYADYIVFDVEYTKTIDNGSQGTSKGNNSIFVGVGKETEDSPWRIDSIFTGW